MGDLPIEKGHEDQKTRRTDVIPTPAEMKKIPGAFQVIESVKGNEAMAIIKMLEGINKNLAFLAATINNHLNPPVKTATTPGGKDGRPRQ